jgi:RimJ/RimL family protein N-acetyltransferase
VKTLRTDRLILRQWTESDVDFVFDMYSRWEVQQYIGLTPRVMEDRSEAVALIDRLRALDDPICGRWAVESAASGGLTGMILLKPIPASGRQDPLLPSGDIEIGWHFHPASWGRGFATEAAAVVLAHAFASGLDRVVAVTNPQNIASQKVCTRIGMRHEGQTTRYYNATCELFTASTQHAR